MLIPSLKTFGTTPESLKSFRSSPEVAQSEGHFGLLWILSKFTRFGEYLCHAPDIFHFSFPLSLFISSLKDNMKWKPLCYWSTRRTTKVTRHRTTRLLDVVIIPIQDVIPILPHQIVIVHQPLDVSRLTKDGVFELQHPIPLVT